MARNTDRPIGSHFVPQRILEGFVDPDRRPFVWVYEKGTLEVVRRHPKVIGAERGLYSFPSIRGGTDHRSMERLANTIETRAWPVLDKLEHGRAVTLKERWKAAAFLAFQIFRTPHFFDSMRELADQLEAWRLRMIASHPESRAQVMEAMRERFGPGVDLPTEDEVRTILGGGQFTLAHDRSVVVRQIPNVLEWADTIFAMSWQVLTAPPGCWFVSSDNPFVRLDLIAGSLAAGLRVASTEVCFALSQRTALIGNWSDGSPLSTARATRDQVDEINARTIANAVRWVYAPAKSDRLNGWVQATEGSAPRVRVL